MKFIGLAMLCKRALGNVILILILVRNISVLGMYLETFETSNSELVVRYIYFVILL